MTPKDTEGYAGEERRVEPRVTRPFKLVRHFSITSAAAFLAAVIAVAVLHHWTSKKDLVRLAEIETIELGQTLANATWPHISRLMEQMATLDADALRSQPETRQIHDVLKKATVGLPVLKIKIYDLSGRTIYSTDAKEIGEDKSGNAGVISAAKNRTPASQLSRKGSITAFSGVLFDRDAVETYIPVYGPTGAVVAVFELYNDVSRTVDSINRMLRGIVISLVVAFILLYGGLYLIVRRGDRILQLQGLDIRYKSESLIAKNTDLEREINERKQIEGHLQGAIQSLQEAFAFFDADDRLVFHNDEYRRLHPLGDTLIKPGVRFEDIVRTNIEKGNIADAIGREEEHIRERIELHRNPKGPILRRLTDGRTFIISETRTPDGGTCITLVDVSEVKRAEEMAKLSEGRLQGAVAAIQEGFAYYDADDRLVIFNEEYRRLHVELADILKPGMVFEDMIRTAVRRKEISDSDGREEEFIQERLAQHRDPKGPILRTLANGTKYVINESRTPDGGVVVTEVDVTERLRAEEALRLGESRLRGAIESMQEGFALYDRDDRLVAINEVFKTWNPDAEKILKKGGTFEELLRLNIKRGALVEAIGREEKFLKERLERRRKQGKPMLRRFSDGRLCIVRETLTPEGGTAVTLSDVTDLIRTEEALKESQQALQAVINAVPAMVNVKDSQSRYVFMNRYQASLYSTTPEKAVGKTAAELINETYGAETAAIDAGVLATNRAKSNYEEDWIDLAGNRRVLLTTKAPLVNESGIPDRVLTVSLDISDRKRAEDARRFSDERLRGAINSLSEGFLLLDADDRILAVNELYLTFNPAAKAIMERGGRYEDLIRANVERGAIVEAIGREEEHIQKRLEQHRNRVSPIMRQFSDGRWFIVNETETQEGGTALTFSDVTELKRAEQALRESEQRLINIIDSVPAIINVKDTESRYLLSNRYHLDMLNVKEADLLGKVGGYFNPEHAKRLRDMELKVIETGKVQPLYDQIHRSADGKKYHFMFTKAPLRDIAGKIIGTVTAGIDVTERRKLEEAVEAERRRLIDAIESIEGGAILYDADDRIVLFNSIYCQHLDAIEHVLVPGTRFEDVIRAVVKAGLVEEAVRNPEKYLRERIARHRALSPSLLHMIRVDRWYLIREYRTSDGGTLIIRTDVTEQKRIEEALRASEERFRDFAESASDWYWQTGPDHRCTFVSDRFFDETGFHPADIIGKTFAEFAGIEIASENPEMWEIHEGLMEKHQPFQNFEYAQHDAEGVRQYVRVSGKPFFDADGKFAGYRGVATDITERHDTEAALQRSEARLRDIADAVSDWFWEIGPDFRYTFVSDRFFKETAYPPEDVLGKTRLEFIGDRLVDKDEAAWRAHQDDLEHHRPFRNFEYCRRDRSGDVRYKRVSGKPFFDHNGIFLGYRGNTTDITESRRGELELIQSKKMESLGSIAGGIAHNLNNTLQPIMILSQMTRDALPKDSDEHQNLQLINQACARAKELVDRILAFSREKSYHLDHADIYEIVREELDLIRSFVPTNITIHPKLNKKTGIVYVDPIQTQTVLMNVFANAIDALGDKPGKIKISLSRARVGSSSANAVATLKKGDYAKLTVTDNGPGMDDKTLGRIFDPFFTTKGPNKGTGLGLSTAFGIVSKHGGTIRAFSTPGKGATFEVFLPIAKARKA